MKKSREKRAYFKSPIGLLEITAREKGISSVSFAGKRTCKPEASSILKMCLKQLDEYFSGKRKIFSLPLNLEGSAWENLAWKKMRKIPFGKTVPYSQLFSGRKLARAVGLACRKNKIVIIIPCHRVVGKDGLGGYSAGLKRKKWLLNFEKRNKTRWS